jgi:hypothetical protein
MYRGKERPFPDVLDVRPIIEQDVTRASHRDQQADLMPIREHYMVAKSPILRPCASESRHGFSPWFLHRRFRWIGLTLLPILPVERSVLHGFRDVLRLNLFAPAQVGDGAGDLQDAVVRAS